MPGKTSTRRGSRQVGSGAARIGLRKPSRGAQGYQQRKKMTGPSSVVGGVPTRRKAARRAAPRPGGGGSPRL